MNEAFLNNFLLRVLFKGTVLNDASALATAQICASALLLIQAVGDEKAAA
jgi:hypothetical protein